MIIRPLLGSDQQDSPIAIEDVGLQDVLNLLLVIANGLLVLGRPDEDSQEEERQGIQSDPGLRVLLHAAPHEIHLASEGWPLVSEEVIRGGIEERCGVLHHVGSHGVVLRVHLEVGGIHLWRGEGAE